MLALEQLNINALTVMHQINDPKVEILAFAMKNFMIMDWIHCVLIAIIRGIQIY